MLLLLLALAVILMLSGANAFGFAFGLAVAGMGGILLVSMVLYEVAHSRDHDRPSTHRRYREPAR